MIYIYYLFFDNNKKKNTNYWKKLTLNIPLNNHIQRKSEKRRTIKKGTTKSQRDKSPKFQRYQIQSYTHTYIHTNIHTTRHLTSSPVRRCRVSARLGFGSWPGPSLGRFVATMRSKVSSRTGISRLEMFYTGWLYEKHW